MDGPKVSSSSPTPLPVDGIGNEFTVKQEKPDSDRRKSDKAIQFSLALKRRGAGKGLITTTEQSRPSRKGPIRIQYVDLTQSSDEEDEADGGSSTSQSTIRAEHTKSLHPGHMDTIEREDELSRDTDLMEPSHPPVEDQLESLEPSTTVNSSTAEDEEEVDYNLAMSALEVTMEEAEYNGVDPSYKHRSYSKAAWGGGNTLPYTAEQKEIAMQGNPAFNYTTKLGRNGEEVYSIYKCQKCPTGFPRMHHYLVHLKRHDWDPARKFTCEECDYRTINSLLLANHVERHRLQREPHSFRNMREGGCGGTPANPIAQKRRGESASPDRAAKQQAVDSPAQQAVSLPRSPQLDLRHPFGNLESEDNLRAEARTGNPNIVYRVSKRYRPDGRVCERSSYKCQQCPYNHESYDAYKKHLEGHIHQRPFQCKLCTYSVMIQANLHRHMIVHRSNSRSPPISQANKQYGRGGFRSLPQNRQAFPNGAWRSSAEGVTSPKVPINSIPTASVVLQCSKCPSKFNGTGNLNMHMKQHGMAGMRLRCPHCDFSSNRDDYMQNHVEGHVGLTNGVIPGACAGVQPMTSPKPSARTAAPGSPASPELTEEALAKIVKGNPRFAYMRTSATGQPLPLESSFKCWHCPFATTKFTSYASHEQCHDANGKYACRNCSYSAKTLQGLKNHSLAHTIQHTNIRGAINPQQASTSPPTIEEVVVTSEADTSNPFLIPVTSPMEGGMNTINEKRQFFLSNIKITNVMPMNEEPTVADVSTHGILKLKGNSGEGKSSYILAVMLGMGYDLCLDYKDDTTSICGLNLKNVISHGKDFASVELTLSLGVFPELQKEFGSQIKFSRRINRIDSELSNVLVLSSADPRPQFKSLRPKVLGGKDLEEFLRKLKLSPQRMRLMLLDGENVKYMMDNTHLWFGLFASAVDESAIETEQKIKETQFLVHRLNSEQKSQQERLELLKSRLQECPPLDSDKMRQVKEEDLLNHNKCKADINQLVKDKWELQKKLNDSVAQTSEGTDGFVLRMLAIFNKFIQPLTYSGEIMVSEQCQELCICIWKTESTEVAPMNLDEVKEVWKAMSNGRRRIAVIGLYLAFWEISNYLGILAADASSCTEADFQVPPAGLPILWELVNRKCLEQTQCIISLPPDY